MGEPDRYGRAKVSTVRRDINKLRAAIHAHDLDKIEDAWLDCERWTGFVEARTASMAGADLGLAKQEAANLRSALNELLDTIERLKAPIYAGLTRDEETALTCAILTGTQAAIIWAKDSECPPVRKGGADV